MAGSSAGLASRVSFDRIRYASCWEDAAVLLAALAPGPGDRCLSIASAGDNSFTLLAAGAEVVAADLSPAQLYLVELKAACARSLAHADALAFLGARECDDRPGLLRQLLPDLTPGARAYWEGQREAIAAGPIHAGRFEGYFRLFRTRVLPLVHRRRTVEALLRPRDREERERFYEDRWDTWRWRLLFRLFFGRWAMGRLGRDPELFRYVEGSVAERILARARYALTALPVHDNPYVEYILRGTFRDALPPWLEPATFARIGPALGRLTLFQGGIEEAARAHGAGGFSGFNLSDVFEYLDPEGSAGLYGDLLAHARPGARFAYWNLLVPRERPAGVADRVASHRERAAELLARDRAFFYSRFVLEEVVA